MRPRNLWARAAGGRERGEIETRGNMIALIYARVGAGFGRLRKYLGFGGRWVLAGGPGVGVWFGGKQLTERIFGRFWVVEERRTFLSVCEFR